MNSAAALLSLQKCQKLLTWSLMRTVSPTVGMNIFQEELAKKC